MMDLWKHQKDAIAAAKNKDSFGLLFDAGTGKTRTAIEIYLAKVRLEGRALRTLILCPQVVMQNWRDEFKKYSDIYINDIILLRGAGVKRYEDMMAAAGTFNG
jgi:N12 class adenine-specific DNA methylase